MILVSTRNMRTLIAGFIDYRDSMALDLVIQVSALFLGGRISNLTTATLHKKIVTQEKKRSRVLANMQILQDDGPPMRA